MSQRTIVVGDLHGCYDETVELLDRCQATSSDRIIFVGDIIDRGPKPRECIELVKKHESVMGNHELIHVNLHNMRSAGMFPKCHQSIAETAGILDDADINWFKSLPKYIEIGDEKNSAVVHAGAWNDIPLRDQPVELLSDIRYINPTSGTRRSVFPSRVAGDASWRFWSTFWSGPERLIFGHSVLTDPLVTDRAVGIDGGCCFGLELWAYIIPDDKVVRVKSRQPLQFQPDTYHIAGNTYSY